MVAASFWPLSRRLSASFFKLNLTGILIDSRVDCLSGNGKSREVGYGGKSFFNCGGQGGTGSTGFALAPSGLVRGLIPGLDPCSVLANQRVLG